MKKYTICIELLSDMCVSDGGVYNSMLDIDVCYDKYGIPYIPAKRLKGCLREAALELNDWGEDIDIKGIFGDKGSYNNASHLVISNAYIIGYADITKEIDDNQGHFIYHTQRVLNNYTYIRNQTSINYETGIAENASLRSMRVIKKGLKFEAEILIEESYKKDIEKCVKVLTNMGVSRTRGLGEVKATLSDTETVYELEENKYVENANVLHYEIYLKEPIITLSASGLQEKARDYIDGASVVGLVLSRLDGPEKDKLLSEVNNLCFSNAYITNNGKRYTEIPAYISAIKNNPNDFINNLYYDRNKNEGIQINAAKHSYVYMQENELEKVSVDMEQRYHHRRPDDKSIGRAKSQDGGDSDFYQIESINGGQRFSGFITGNPDLIKTVYDVISSSKECRIGYGRNAEYGLSEIKVVKTEESVTIKESKVDRIVVKLNSPAIIYNDRAMYSVSIDDLIEEILFALNIDSDMVDKDKTGKYVNYISMGGYNVTWNMRKPTITAFDKGTSIDIYLKECINVDIPFKLFIGERNTEGYGECEIKSVNPNGQGKGKIKKIDSILNNSVIDIKSKHLGKVLAENIMDEYIRELVIKRVEEAKINEKTKATVSNMILMCKEFNSIKDVKNAIEERYSKKSGDKEEKKAIALSIIKIVEKEVNNDTFYDEFGEKYKIKGIRHDDEVYCMRFLELFLQELKYKARLERIGE